MKILLYSHDTNGLGHFRRCLKIASQLSEDLPEVSQFLITGSNYIPYFEVPQSLDYLKLPTITRTVTGEYQSEILPLDFKTIKKLREALILDTVKQYRPDLFLIDELPAGVEGEIVKSLYFLKQHCPNTQIVLGMRDIEDEGKLVCNQWQKQGVYQLLEDVYSTILLYGMKKVYDPTYEYHLSESVSAKIVPCGFIGVLNPSLTDPIKIRQHFKVPQNKKLIVVTTGGGADGAEIILKYLKMLASFENQIDFYSVVITGPMFINNGLFDYYKTLNLKLAILEFTPDLLNVFNASDLIISMGGYNSLFEIVSLKKKAIIIPRIKPRLEQFIRGQKLSQLGLMKMIHPNKLTPENLFSEIKSTLNQKQFSTYQQVGLNLNGLENTCRAIKNLLTNIARSRG